MVRHAGAWAEHKKGPTPRGEARLLTVGQQHVAYKMTPRTLKWSSVYLRPRPTATGTRKSFLRGKSAKYGQLFPSPSQSDWLGVLSRKQEKSKEAEKEKRCWNLDKGHSSSQWNSPDHPEANICCEEMRNSGPPGSHRLPTTLKAKHTQNYWTILPL